MTQIVWTTPAGNIDPSAENVEYSFQLEAENSINEPLTYTTVAGKLPPGIQLYPNGLLYGIPNIIEPGNTLKRTFKFTVRAVNSRQQIADRSFSIIINALVPPTLSAGISTASSTISLGQFFDSDFVDIALPYTETNPGTTLTWAVTAGTLPAGLELTQTGHITGFALAPPAAGAAGTSAYDAGKYDEFVWDYEGSTLSRTYRFGIRLFDGILSADRYYSISIQAKSFFRTDNNLILADTALFTTDRDGYAYPTITTTQSELLAVRQGRSYAFQFKAYYFDPARKIYWRLKGSGPERFDMGALPVPDDQGNNYPAAPYDTKGYDQADLALPPGLTLDNTSGWLTGTLGTVNANSSKYTFQIVAYVQITNSVTNQVSIRESNPITFTLKVLESSSDYVIWDTDSNLGTIENGRISTLRIQAHANRGQQLSYSIQSGGYTKLPQGLSLLSSGLISGRTTFDYFSMDRTAFEVTSDKGTTRFDSTYTFTVLAQDSTGYIYDTKTFTVTVTNVNQKPFENLYVRAFLPSGLRERFRTTIQDPNITIDIGINVIYRVDDPYFGIANEIKFLAIPGLHASQLRSYIEGMDIYHKNKQISFSTLKLAYAIDNNTGAVKYEVIYVEILDYNTAAASSPSYSLTKLNISQVLDSGAVTTSNLTNEDYGILNEGTYVDENYDSLANNTNFTSTLAKSNSFGNMSNELVNRIGYEYQGALPEWMTSIQPDTGQALGFTRAAVLAYVKPGSGKLILFRYTQSLIQSGFGLTALLNQYAFTADRYQLDRSLTVNYDPGTQKFTKATSTSFDRIPSIGEVDRGAWKEQVTDTTQPLRSIDFGQGEYIAVGDSSTIITSTGGEIWKPVPLYIDFTYRVGLGVAAPSGSTELEFPYGAHFSLGDELLNAGSFVSSAKSFITSIRNSVYLNQTVKGTVPANTNIEFFAYDGSTFSERLLTSVTTNERSLFLSNVSPINRGYGVQIKGIDTHPSPGERVVALNGNVILSTLNVGLGYNPSTVSVVFSAPTAGGITATGSAYLFANGAVKAVKLIEPGLGYVEPPSITFLGANTTIATATVSAITNRGPRPCQVDTNNTGTNTITMTRPTTNLVVAGTRVTFDDLSGTLVNLITSTDTVVGANTMVFTTSTASVNTNAYMRLANIWAGTAVQGLNSNITITTSNLNNLPLGTELTFKNKITSPSMAGDSIINLSSTDKIGIGTRILGKSVLTATVGTATWPALLLPGTTLDITIPTADIIGTYPEVGMTVIGYQLPADNNITAVTTYLTDTIITIEFNSTTIVGNPKYNKTAVIDSTTGTVSTLFGVTQKWANGAAKLSTQTIIVVNNADNVGLNYAVTTANIPAISAPRVTNFLNNDITIVESLSFAVIGTISGATWDAVSGATSLVITVPTASIVGFSVTNAQFIRAEGYYQIPTNTISGVSVVGLNTLITISFITAVTIPRSPTKLSIEPGPYTIYATESVGFQPQVSKLDLTSPSLVAPGTVVTAKTATSIVLSKPLLSDINYEYDNLLQFALGDLQLNYVLYTARGWLAVGTKGTVLSRSETGIWSETNAVVYGDLTGIAYNPTGTYIVIGTEGLVARSTDFVNWVPVAVGVNVTLRSVDYHDGTFVIVGDQGTIVYSTDDGLTWGINNSATTRNLKSVRYINNIWVAVGEQGLVMYSTTGTQWPYYQIFNAGVTNTLYDVTYLNNQYVAVGAKGIIVTSTDVSKWSVAPSPYSQDLYGIANNTAISTISGDQGLVLSASDTYTVDWAVQAVSFEMFNWQKVRHLAAQGYSVKDGDTLIFVQQEGFDPTQYRGSSYTNEGWNYYTDLYDGSSASKNYDSLAFDNFNVIPGFVENLADPAQANQRAGVWQVTINANGVVYLEFVRPVRLNQIVTVKADTTRYVYDPTINPDNTVPKYRSLYKQVNASNGATTFDSNGTRFSAPRDSYLEDPYVYDKYLKFPSTGVI